MDKTEHVIITDFGMAKVPGGFPPYRMTKNRRPDRRYRIGKQILAFERDMSAAALALYVKGDDLTVTPPFAEWLAKAEG